MCQNLGVRVKGPYQQFIELVSRSDLSEADLRLALRELAHMGASDFVSLVRKHRKGIDVGDPIEQGKRRKPLAGMTRDVADQVDRLLRLEAGLPAAEAARELIATLALPSLPNSIKNFAKLRISFLQWVDRLSTHVPPSEILHAATAIRNSRVHLGTAPWALKK
jgi:hypothetical protein